MRLSAGLPMVLAIAAGCSGGKGGNYSCGFTAVAGQSMLIDEFNRPNTVLARPPANLPGALPVRIALGPVFPSIAGRADTMVVVGVEGALPPTPPVGFGVLVVNPQGEAQGVLLYEGNPIQGAPLLGSVNASGRDLPLIGLSVEISRFEKPGCPIFPDSLRK